MRTLVRKLQATDYTGVARSSVLAPRHHGALQRHAEASGAGLIHAQPTRSGGDLCRIPAHSRSAPPLQARLTINRPGDRYEQEADRVATQVMRMGASDTARAASPAIARLGAGYRDELAAQQLQRRCSECGEQDDETLQRRDAGARGGTGPLPRQVEAKVDAVGGGAPLTKQQRAYFEPRFAADFSHVRIHTDAPADSAARAVGALAYTRGSDIVFRGDQYRPHDVAGQLLLAHELTHVVQQGTAPALQRQPADGSGPQPIHDAWRAWEWRVRYCSIPATA